MLCESCKKLKEKYKILKKEHDKLIRDIEYKKKCKKYGGKKHYEKIKKEIREAVKTKVEKLKEIGTCSMFGIVFTKVSVFIPWSYSLMLQDIYYHQIEVDEETFNFKSILELWERAEDRREIGNIQQKKENEERNRNIDMYKGLTMKEALGDPF